MKNRKGFTLIELLVVVSIIALLVSILMPALAKAKQSALAAKCLVQVRNYNIGINLFAADHNDKLWYEGPNGASYGQRGHGLWMYRLRDYYDEADEARYCPVVNETDLSSVAMGGGAYHGSAFQSWNMAGHAGIPNNQKEREIRGGSYGINIWIALAPNGESVWGAPSPISGTAHGRYWQGVDVAGVSTADIPMVGDCTWFGVEPSNEQSLRDLTMVGDAYEYRHPEDVYRDAPPGVSGNSFTMYFSRVMIPRHLGKVNWGFMDGSARPVALQDLPALKWHREYKKIHDVFIPWQK